MAAHGSIANSLTFSLLPSRKKLRRLIPRLNLYQAKRKGATRERWSMIADNLGGDERSLLDIGCNMGALTAQAAQTGMVAVGFDGDALAIRRAGEQHRAVQGVAFGRLVFTPEVVRALPDFDVMLCLSVHHYWARTFGDTASWTMVQELMARTKRKFFFEPASARSKYGSAAPPIVDLDRNSIIAHTTQALNQAGNGAFTVAYVGETAALSREPFRLMFCATRT